MIANPDNIITRERIALLFSIMNREVSEGVETKYMDNSENVPLCFFKKYAIETFLKFSSGDGDYLMFLPSEYILNSDVVYSLRNDAYMNKLDILAPMTFSERGLSINAYKGGFPLRGVRAGTGIVEVEAISDVFLISRKALLDIEYSFIVPDGEDILLCKKARNMGYRIYLHTGYSCHTKVESLITYEQYLKYDMEKVGQPKIRVCVPVYNGKLTVVNCLKSLINQNYNNYEILVWDDGSNDGSLAEVDDFLDKEQKEYISMCTNEVNIGLPQTLNKALFYEGNFDFFTYIACDNEVTPDFLIKHIETMIKTGAKMTYSDYCRTGGEKKEVVSLSSYGWEEMLQFYRFGVSLMYDAKLLKSFGGFDETLKHAHDYDVAMKFLKEYKVKHVPEVLMFYKQHEGRELSEKNQELIDEHMREAEIVKGRYRDDKNIRDKGIVS